MSRDLDAKLAEKLFGHPVEMRHLYICNDNEPKQLAYFGDAPRGVVSPDSPGWFEVPAFSTTYEGMGLVIEEMRKRGWDVALHLPSVDYENKPYVILTGPEKRHDGLSGLYEADTAPLAVAKAAEAALEDQS